MYTVVPVSSGPDWSGHTVSNGHHWPALTLFYANLPDWSGQTCHTANGHQYSSNIHCVPLRNGHMFDCKIDDMSRHLSKSIVQWSRRHFPFCDMLATLPPQCFVPLLTLVRNRQTFSLALPIAIWPWFEPIIGTYFYMCPITTAASVRYFAAQTIVCFLVHIASSSCTVPTVASDTLSKLETPTSSSDTRHWFYTMCA